ncbi:MAG: O-antigen ligase family protein [bacterium]
MNILIFLFVVLFFMLAWRRIDWAVMLLIAAMPAYLIRFNIFGLPSTLLEAMIWIVFLAWAVKNFKKENEKNKIRYLFDWEIILLLVIALAAAGTAGFSSSSFGIWKAYFFEPALFFIVVMNAMKGEKGGEKILSALAVSALAVSALAIYQKITGQLIDNPVWADENIRRVVSFFGYPNAVGLYLGPIVLAMAGWLAFAIIRNEKIKAFFISLAIIASVVSVYFAKSKGALIGVAAGLIAFGLMAGKKMRWAAIAVILVMAGCVFFYQPVGKLAHDTFAFKTLSGQIRMAGWKDSWNMLKDGRFLTGAGLANFQNAVKPYHQEGVFVKDAGDPDAQRKLVFNKDYRDAHWQPLEIYLYPHNIFLNFWSELGLAGALLFVWIIGKFFAVGIRNLQQSPKNKYLAIGLICSMIAIIVHGLADVPYFKNDLAAMFWLLAAMMSLINLENNKINL